MALFSVVLVASDNSANTATVNLNPVWVQDVLPANSSDTGSFSTAQTAILYIIYEQNQRRTRRLLTASSVATVTAAIAAAQANVLGAGQSGQTALVAGTKAITIPGLTTSSIALVSLVASNTGSSTVTYQAVCTANTLTLRANVAAGTINVADISTVNYAIVG